MNNATLPGEIDASEVIAELSFSNPELIVRQFGLLSGSVVADFGSGSGAYALALSRSVGKEGIVYAIDIQQGLLDRLKNIAKNLGVENIKTIWADLEKNMGSGLQDASVSLVVLANTLFQSEQRQKMIEEAVRVLKEVGVLVIVDWMESFNGLGPPKDLVCSEADAFVLAKQFGLTHVENLDAGKYHYGLVFKKSKKLKF